MLALLFDSLSKQILYKTLHFHSDLQLEIINDEFKQTTRSQEEL